MQVLVTGATGVVGRRVVPLLVARSHRVKAIGRSPERLAALEREGAVTSRADLLDLEALRAAVEGCDAVLNLATMRLLGSAGELLSRSQRISNRKLRRASAWAPKYPSVREACRDVVPALEKHRAAA